MNHRQIRQLVFASCVFILGFTESYSQVAPNKPPALVDGRTRRTVVENIIRELRDKYIAPEKNKDIEAYLRTRLKEGEYDKIDNPREFAATLTQHLRTAARDLHLFVTYDPALESALLAAPPAPSVDLPELPPTAEQIEKNRRSNYDFRKLEIMRGNVGYLSLARFVDLNQSKDTAVAAMNFLANADAIIIDLRDNPGGFINLQVFLASYFYGVDPIELLSRYHREGNVTVREWTLRVVPGKRLPYTDLYILTSQRTGSAGEGFAFILQQRKRAKIVGEKTSGAGYGNKETPIGSGFVFYVSTFRPFDPRSGRGWQEVGVSPDIVVPADRALSAAHFEAVKHLSRKPVDQNRKQELSWLAELLEFEASGAKHVNSSLLESYAGKYEGGTIVVTLEQGQLFFLGVSGVKRKLLALSEDTFLIEDASVSAESQARVRFVRDANGVVTKLELLVSDGRAFPRKRDLS